MSCIAIIFAGISLRHFIRRRLSFAAHLSSSNSALTPSRYIRLMTMAALQMVWSISATVYALIFMFVSGSLRPWTTWADVHSDWLRVDAFPDAFAPPFVRRAFYVLWWIIPISTFLFVVFFSFGKDAMDEYKKCGNWVCTKVFRQDSSTSGKSKKSRFSISMTRFRSLRGLPISNPTSFASNMTESTPPSYDASTSTCTPEKLWHVLDDKASQVSQDVETACPQSQPKAMSSYSDLSFRPPSTIIGSSPADNLPELTLGLSSETQMPPTPPPLTPPPRNPRLRPPQHLARSSTASRPLTYPSFEAAQRSVNSAYSESA
jgi:pheromone a factor receptor